MDGSITTGLVDTFVRHQAAEFGLFQRLTPFVDGPVAFATTVSRKSGLQGTERHMAEADRPMEPALLWCGPYGRRRCPLRPSSRTSPSVNVETVPTAP